MTIPKASAGSKWQFGIVCLFTLASAAAATPPRWPFPLYFESSVEYASPAPQGPRACAAGDFNEDGMVDLVISSISTAWFYAGLGPGTFAAPVASQFDAESEWMAHGIAAADFHGDGHLDLVVLADHQMWTLAGRGDGTFEPEVVLALTIPGTILRHVALADYDGDGDVDLAITGGKVWILTNDGSGSFAPSATYILPTSFGTTLHFLAAADLDQDGDIDLVVPKYGNPSLYILRNSGDGTFAPFETITITWPTDAVPLTGVTTADLDNDDDVDIVVADLSGRIWLFENIGAGTFVTGAPVPTKTPLEGGAPWSVACADFNGDGLIDIAYTVALGSGVRILSNEGGETLMFGLTYPVATGSFPYEVLVANMDGDCDFDLVTANLSGDSFSVLLNSTSDIGTCAVTDLSSDGAVDMLDVLLVVAEWGQLNSPADLNYDGIVNGIDLVQVLANWDPSP